MSTYKDKRKYGDGWKDKSDKQRQMEVEQTNKVQGQIDNHVMQKKKQQQKNNDRSF